MIDFWFAIIMMVVIFALGLISFKIPFLGMIGIIIGIITLYPLAVDGNVRWGYTFDQTAQVVVPLTSTEVPMQYLAIIIIFVCIGLTLWGIIDKMSG
jgi:hypothetical protein